ncbi:hypothetical protein Agabi119p4_11748 [Agaricus bisporus var. burnettii]|uniref:Uncharacterized protein n=1 Tax=Agaricus bisporus var. burnettii TaxID=192524 RepID=A0A8H7C0W6_AGABI|nr:hypothetical protein Agabi119p4_11748 [Agaricus bisporus var. burnettii]
MLPTVNSRLGPEHDAVESYFKDPRQRKPVVTLLQPQIGIPAATPTVPTFLAVSKNVFKELEAGPLYAIECGPHRLEQSRRA